jgi:hypothetical protein
MMASKIAALPNGILGFFRRSVNAKITSGDTATTSGDAATTAGDETTTSGGTAHHEVSFVFGSDLSFEFTVSVERLGVANKPSAFGDNMAFEFTLSVPLPSIANNSCQPDQAQNAANTLDFDRPLWGQDATGGDTGDLSFARRRVSSITATNQRSALTEGILKEDEDSEDGSDEDDCRSDRRMAVATMTTNFVVCPTRVPSIASLTKDVGKSSHEKIGCRES